MSFYIYLFIATKGKHKQIGSGEILKLILGYCFHFEVNYQNLLKLSQQQYVLCKSNFHVKKIVVHNCVK